MSQVKGAPDAGRLLLRLTAQIAIIGAVALALSTWLWIDIPVYDGVKVGHLVVTAALLLLAHRVLATASPLASILSSGVQGSVERVGMLAAYGVYLVALGVLYFALKWAFILALHNAFYLSVGDAAVIYDALFLVAAAYLVYSAVRVVTG